MKTKQFFFILLISLLGFTQVKADTIYYQLPGSAQLCQDPLAFDTFVFYHPFPSIASWSVSFNGGSFISSGIGDSLLLIPTMVGNYAVVATYSGIPEVFTLILYSTPPAHADFSVLSGGEINLAGDTVWMCEGSVSLATNTIGSQAVSYAWYGPGGYVNTLDDPLLVSTPGMWVFERSNPCGVTRDTIEVVSLPTNLPVFIDTTFCNVSVELLLDAGPGFDYQWSTSETMQTIFVTSPGTYSVSVSNVCISGSASLLVEEETFPLPDLMTYSQIPSTILCQNEVAILDPYPGYPYDTYQWYQGTTPIGNQSTLTVDYIMGNENYFVEVSQGNCSAMSNVWVEFYQDPESPTHCVSSFDPFSGTNMSVFEVHPEPDVTDYILFYQQGVNWIPLDTVAATGLFLYTLYDDINDPNQQSYTYAVFAQHSCGHLSPLIDWHKTIRIGIFQDVLSGDYVLQILDDYETMSGYEPSSYTIWIDSLNNGNFTDIGILNGGNTSFTITNPVSGAAYYASVYLPWNCEAKSFPEAFSNKRLFNLTDIDEYNLFDNIKIYPNPATSQINIITDQTISEITVYSITGQQMLKLGNTNTVDVSGLAAGNYSLKIVTEGGVFVERVVVE